MGQVIHRKVIILLLLMCFSSIVIWRLEKSSNLVKNIDLKSAFSNIHGWKNLGFVELDQEIIEGLQLDDYLNISYNREENIVQLYIGYYLSIEKIGAAHDPLVCFTGQGWKVSDKKRNNIVLDSSTSISFTSMIAERLEDKRLVLYWFQSNEKANSNTFKQKINLIFSKIMGRGEVNALVRISSDISDREVNDVMKAQIDFLKYFYPLFLKYIEGKI